MNLQPGVTGAAGYSGDGRHRYWLTRTWNTSLPDLGWVMLNPSTATEDQDDPTIRRCQSFARQWGYGRVTIANVWSLRSTDPRALLTEPVRVHQLAMESLRWQMSWVCAWGSFVERVPSWRSHLREVMDLLEGAADDLSCLGRTKGGHPLHPLYLKADRPRIPFDGYAFTRQGGGR